jgi:CheY-like chemotaxis protein
MRASRSLSTIPVIVLTSSSPESDKEKAMDQEADLYGLKPNGVREWGNLDESIGQFWIRRASYKGPDQSPAKSTD